MGILIIHKHMIKVSTFLHTYVDNQLTKELSVKKPGVHIVDVTGPRPGAEVLP